MPKFESLFGDAKVDTSDVGGSAKSIAYAVGGVGLMVVVLNYGQQVGNYITTRIDNIAGTNASGNGGFSLRGEL